MLYMFRLTTSICIIFFILIFSIPIHVRPIVYNYHFQNTYSIRDWEYAFIQYETTNDVQEEERLLQALTFTRIPSQLTR